MGEPAFEQIFREQAGLVLASLIATFRDFDLAEDAFQDATLRALESWPGTGLPERPGAWLLTTARRRALDRLRRADTRARRQDALQAEWRLQAAEREDARPAESAGASGSHAATGREDAISDERLRLVFTCCHPALSPEARVALTLRLLGGLTTSEVAAAFLVPEPTMAKRLVRAKHKIRESRIPYRVPDADDLQTRLASVLSVLYLIFNQGWSHAEGAASLCDDAVRMTRVLDEAMPGEPEVAGLLALMLLNRARRGARIVDGCWIPLERQDPARWHWPDIREALTLLTRALGDREMGPYRLQAAISALHARRIEDGETPWAEISGLYARLAEHDPSPVIALNRAVAESHVVGPEAALGRLDGLSEASRRQLDAYQPWHSARADLLERAGRVDEARTALERAIACAPGEPERRYLAARLAGLATRTPEAR